MLQIAAEIIFYHQVAFVDRGNEGQRVHVLEYSTVFVMHDDTFGIAPRQSVDPAKVTSFRYFLDSEIKLVACDEIDRSGSLQRRLRLDRDLGPDHADFQAGFK